MPRLVCTMLPFLAVAGTALAAPAVSVPSTPSVTFDPSSVLEEEPVEIDFGVLAQPDRLMAPVQADTIISDPGEAFIVNGEEVPDGDYPQVVYLSIRGSTGASSCTGSLIHEEWILTAAHCVDSVTVDGNGALVREELFPSNEVVATFTNNIDDGGESVTSSGIVVHQNWKTGDGHEYDGDIALIKLSTPQTGKPLMPLNSETLTSENVGDPIQFIGFGIIEHQGPGGGVKRKNLEKISSISETYSFLLNSFDSENNQSTCQGDSGGPGVFLQCGGFIQATITSHGPVPCGAGPSGHMRVDTYIPWIEEYVPELLKVPVNVPSFQCSNLIDPDDEDTVALGVVPFELKCSVDYETCAKDDPNDTEGDLVRVNWSWGDGSDNSLIEEATGDVYRASHTYDENGRYSVKMEATYIQNEKETVKELTRFGYVRACGPPDVGFSVVKDEGLTYAFINETNIASAYGCVFGTQWDLYEGDSASGDPMQSLKTWEPTFTFDKPGTYTAVLNIGGFTGTEAAKATFKVTAARGAEASGCSQSGSPAGALALLAVGGLLSLRRRD